MLNIQLENASEAELAALKQASLIDRHMIAGMNRRYDALTNLLGELRELRDTSASDDEAKVFEFDIAMIEDRIATFLFVRQTLVKLGFATHEERPKVHTLAGTRRLIAETRKKRAALAINRKDEAAARHALRPVRRDN